MPHRRAATLSLIRHLTAYALVKPRRRVGRWPAPVHPDAIGTEYYAAIVREVCRPAREAFRDVEGDVLRLLAAVHAGHADSAIGPGRAAQLGEKAAREEEDTLERQLRGASESGKRAAALIDRAARSFAERFHPHALHDVVAQFGKTTDRHARLQLDQQLRTAIGVPLSAIEKPMQDRLGEWVAGNVALIQTVPDRYFNRVQEDVQEAFAGGMHPSTLADQMAEDYEISDRDAERIARDQVLSLAADLNHGRMEALGIERAVWMTMNDGRVCEICEARQGEEFNLAEGIEGELPSECHPEDRCYSAPILDDLLGALDT